MAQAPQPTHHVSVLLEGVLAHLPAPQEKAPPGKPLAGCHIVDGTFGGGGYSAAFLRKGAHVLGLDQDAAALARGQKLQQEFPETLALAHTSFAHLQKAMQAQGWDKADAIVLDLGLSSDQLDDPERGFTYQEDGPLDMRMQQTGPTAADILRTESEAALARIFKEYGDEPKAKRLAQAIVFHRKEAPLETTHAFLEVIEQVYPPRAGLNRRHPAQRIFQALRIAVNGELQALEEVLPQAIDALAVGGRLLIVSFHSLEDRMVKRAFKAQCQPTLDHIGRQIAEAPFYQPVRKVKPTEAEIVANPRARSATLRVLERRAA